MRITTTKRARVDRRAYSMVNTLAEFREAIEDESTMLKEAERVRLFADKYGKLVHSEVTEVSEWHTSHFEVYEVEFLDGKALFGVNSMVGNTKGQVDVSIYDDIYEVKKYKGLLQW